MKLTAQDWEHDWVMELVYRTHTVEEHSFVGDNEQEVKAILDASVRSAVDAIRRLREAYHARKRIG